MVLLERPKETEKPSPKGGSLEPSSGRGVEEGIEEGGGVRFTVEERERLVQFFILLDQMDRAHARVDQERRAA